MNIMVDVHRQKEQRHHHVHNPSHDLMWKKLQKTPLHAANQSSEKRHTKTPRSRATRTATNLLKGLGLYGRFGLVCRHARIQLTTSVLQGAFCRTVLQIEQVSAHLLLRLLLGRCLLLVRAVIIGRRLVIRTLLLCCLLRRRHRGSSLSPLLALLRCLLLFLRAAVVARVVARVVAGLSLLRRGGRLLGSSYGLRLLVLFNFGGVTFLRCVKKNDTIAE